jgi:hypothetical protein
MADPQALPYPPGTNTVGFHRWQFIAERAGWVVMALVLLWALLGGFGEGWLSEQETWNQSQTLRASYERYGRRDAPHELKLLFEPKSNSDQLLLHVNREFVESVRIDRVTPRYDSMIVEADGVILVFQRAAAEGNYSVIIEYKPRHVGSLHASMHPGDRAPITLNQFVYP